MTTSVLATTATSNSYQSFRHFLHHLITFSETYSHSAN